MGSFLRVSAFERQKQRNHRSFAARRRNCRTVAHMRHAFIDAGGSQAAHRGVWIKALSLIAHRNNGIAPIDLGIDMSIQRSGMPD